MFVLTANIWLVATSLHSMFNICLTAKGQRVQLTMIGSETYNNPKGNDEKKPDT